MSTAYTTRRNITHGQRQEKLVYDIVKKVTIVIAQIFGECVHSLSLLSVN
jgi:hypothetical protein